MFNRRYMIVTYPLLAFTALIVLSGCMSKEEKIRSDMRKKMGEIPEKYKNDGASVAGAEAEAKAGEEYKWWQKLKMTYELAEQQIMLLKK